MAFLVATTSLPAVYRPNVYALTTTAGTPHARANYIQTSNFKQRFNYWLFSNEDFTLFFNKKPLVWLRLKLS